MSFLKESEGRRQLEKNIFIFVLAISGLAMMTWTKDLLNALVNLEIPAININVATILGLAMLYLLYRYLRGRI